MVIYCNPHHLRVNLLCSYNLWYSIYYRMVKAKGVFILLQFKLRSKKSSIISILTCATHHHHDAHKHHKVSIKHTNFIITMMTQSRSTYSAKRITTHLVLVQLHTRIKMTPYNLYSEAPHRSSVYATPSTFS